MAETTRWKALVAKYGLFGAIQPYFFGDKPPVLTEHQAKLKWYTQALIYATSVATLFVFGIAEIYLILHSGWSILSGILIVPIGLLLIMVYAMDRSFATTIPRIPLLAQRGQWGLFAEHVAFALCVSTIEAFTYGLVIYTMENNIQALIAGRSIVPPGFGWVIGLIVARAILLVWTIWHAHFTSEELPVQWGTVERALSKLIGGSIMADISQLDFTNAPLADKMKIQMRMLQPVPRAPWQWNRRARRTAQAALDLAHQMEVIESVKGIHHDVAAVPPVTVQPEAPIPALPEPPAASNGHAVAPLDPMPEIGAVTVTPAASNGHRPARSSALIQRGRADHIETSEDLLLRAFGN